MATPDATARRRPWRFPREGKNEREGAARGGSRVRLGVVHGEGVALYAKEGLGWPTRRGDGAMDGFHAQQVPPLLFTGGRWPMWAGPGKSALGEFLAFLLFLLSINSQSSVLFLFD